MRFRPLTWLLLSVACFLGALYFWRLGDQQHAKKQSTATAAPSREARAHAPIFGLPASTNSASHRAKSADRFKYRLSNTTNTVGRLAHNNKAILLENALIDTTQPLNLSIPDNLRAKGDPGTYIIQANGPIDDAFRAALKAAGAEIVSYIPNNAYLVRVSSSVAQQFAGVSGRILLPFEPYYKLSPSLLRAVREQETPGATLNVLLFPGATSGALQKLGAVVADVQSPLGRVVTLAGADAAAVASLSEVERVEIAARRAPANDLSRERLGVATDSVTNATYLGLSGSNVLVVVNDSGVDATHPDLTNRVFGAPLQDTAGHGTHVAGIIAGNGFESITVSNASGSVIPASTNQFRGMATNATIYSQAVWLSDFALQEGAARTNALISNNSWGYSSDNDYDIAAASYDAAARDALPETQGSQPVLFVFSTGNDGNGSDNGLTGDAESILSPGTAKNVITVGAIEQLRDITNNVAKDGATNQPWANMTDSKNEVAAFSARGNVGIQIEGDYGRFKPDVVAPGVFVVSARSRQWDTNSYYNPTNHDFTSYTNQTVAGDSLNNYAVYVPQNAVAVFLSISNISPTNITGLPIYLLTNNIPTATTYDFMATNWIGIPTNYPLPLGATLFYSVGNPTNAPVTYDITAEILSTNDVGDYYLVLSNMNNDLGPYYRYETGTSMSAAEVSGVLALIQDYFTNTLRVVPSPALLKAMLINGARSINNIYDLQVQNFINYQGWGLVCLTNSIPSTLPSPTNSGAAQAIWKDLTNGPSPLLLFDQNSTNALATGGKWTTFVMVDHSAQGDPLRITLVWTDPPGNPSAGIKLVNNLDLVVTNIDTGEIFLGNDIEAGANFNFRWDTNSEPNLDVINNVENVYLAPTLGTNYSITVVGRAVNVNAVTAHTNNVAQDFALVISSGGQMTNSLTLTNAANAGLTALTTPNVRIMTNEFNSTPGLSGQLLLNQHVGANTPLLGTNTIALGNNTIWGPNGVITVGMTNQWRFYMLTNDQGYTNAAFATFLPADLGLTRMGVTNYDNPNAAARVEADIDLYVTDDPALTNLAAPAIANAFKSVTRDGTELVVFTNAHSGVYYAGVKSEDQEAAEYAFFGAFSEQPFSSLDNGIQNIRGLNVPAAIPDGTPGRPGKTNVLAIAIYPTTVQRAIVTNIIWHQNFGDLLGALSHNRIAAVLNNHTFPPGDPTPYIYNYIYEDNDQGDIIGSQHSDGPGTLRNFVASAGAGLWLLTELDNALTHTGIESNLWIRLDPSASNAGTNGIVLIIQPNSFAYDAVDVPPEATNLTILVANESATPLPLVLYVRRGDFPTLTKYDFTQTFTLTNSLSINANTLPPLLPGRYYIGIFNPNDIAQTVRLVVRVDLSLEPIKTINFDSSGNIPLVDDAVMYSTITISNIASDVEIARGAVAVAIDHPRISDLVLTLISPKGGRNLLFENRGGPNGANLGGDVYITNYFGSVRSGGPDADVNPIGPVPTSGTLLINYDFYTVPDSIDVYYDRVDIFSPGMVSGAGTFPILYGPGAGTNITIVMNQGTNLNIGTAWTYTPVVVSSDLSYVTFTENTNLSKLPIKFAAPPFVPRSGSSAIWSDSFEGYADGTNTTTLQNLGAWTVLANQVVVTTNPPALDGTNSLAILNGAVQVTLPTLTGRRYILHYAIGNAVESEGGGTATNAVWQAEGVQFTATATNMVLVLNASGNTNLVASTNALVLNLTDTNAVLDAFWLVVDTDVLYFFPEESLDPLIGKSPNGVWTLEIRDDRAGATNNAKLVNWQMQFILATNTTGVSQLTDGVAVTNTIHNCDFAFFTVDVPYQAHYATNILLFATNVPVDVWYSASGAPRGTNAGDFEMFSNVTSGSYVLSYTNGFPQLVPGARYYLGVQIHNCGTLDTNVTFALQVDFGADVVTLTNTIPYTTVNSGTAGFTNDYYHFVVPTNAVRAQFEINDPTTNMALVVRKGLPLPDLGHYSLLSDNPATNDELIILFTNSTPVTLTPGNWYLTAVNLSGGPVSYSIKASTWTTTGQPITITGVGMSSSSFCITWSSLPGVHYFIQGVTNINRPNWTTIVPDILGATGTNATTYCIPLPSHYQFFRVGEGEIFDAFLPPVDLQDGTAVINVIPACQFLYYTVTVPATAVSSTNTVLSASGPVNVWFSQTGYPTGGSASDFLLLSNTASGDSFVLDTNGIPPLVPGATYYLGIENPCSNGSNVTVAVQVDLGFNIIDLENGIAYAAVNSGGSALTDYYHYVVSDGAYRVQFEIDNPSGAVALLARYELPLPSFTHYDYLSGNGGTNTDLIVVLDTSTPMALAPGDWYLSAVNISGGPVSYSIMATEWADTGLPISVSGFSVGAGGLCLTWSSLPGVHYFIQGVTNLAPGMAWQTVVQDILANDVTTTYCVPLPSPYHYFRVGEGIIPTIPPPVVGFSRTGGGWLLQWTGPVSAQYQVQWKDSLSAASWTPVAGFITSTTGRFSFLDDGTLTAPLGPARFYRIVRQ